jgi:hypothetical protein
MPAPAPTAWTPPPPRVPSPHIKFYVFGALLATYWGSCEAVGIGMMVDPLEPEHVGSGAFFAIFSAVMLAVAGLLFWLGRTRQRRVQRLRSLIALASSSVRIPFTALQISFDLPPAETRALVLEAVASGFVRGRLDVEQDAFVSSMADTAAQQVHVQCTHCGASQATYRITGQVSHCSHCRAPLPA